MICGHMRTVGEERVLHVCIKTDIVHEDNHLMVPWQQYADDVERNARERGEETPEWFAVLDSQARHINRQEFIKALREDPTLRAVDPSDPPPPLPDENDPDHVKVDKLRAREEWDARQGHEVPRPDPDEARAADREAQQRREQRRPYLEYMESLDPQDTPEEVRQANREEAETTEWREFLERVDPEWAARKYEEAGQPEEAERVRREARERSEPEPDENGGYPLGRSQGDTWREVHEEDPSAWKPPDDGDRAAEPPAGGTPEADLGWSVTGRGKRSGDVTHLDIKIDTPPPGAGGAGSMASVAEVKASIDAATNAISEAQGAIHAAREKLGEAISAAAAALEGSGHDAVSTGHAQLQQADQELETSIQTLAGSIESFGQYGHGL